MLDFVLPTSVIKAPRRTMLRDLADALDDVRDRRAHDHQVGVGHPAFQLRRGVRDRLPLACLPQARRATPHAHDASRKPSLLQGKSNGAPHEPHSDDGNGIPLSHGSVFLSR